MPVFRLLLSATAVFLAVAFHCANALVSETVRQPHIQVSLISYVEAIAPGDDFFIALSLHPDDDWHVYWQNPGDSGMPPKIGWETPNSVSSESIQWPFPEKIPFGPMVNYGYHSVLLPTRFTLNSKADETSVAVQAKASWLVCKEECIPGKASLTLNIPIAAKTRPASEFDAIQDTLQRAPKTLSLLDGRVDAGENIVIELYGKSPIFRDAQRVQFFPITDGLVENSAKADIVWKFNRIKIQQAKSGIFHQMPAKVEGVIVVDDRQAWHFTVNTQ